MKTAISKIIDHVYSPKRIDTARKNVAVVKAAAPKQTTQFPDITRERWFWDLAELS